MYFTRIFYLPILQLVLGGHVLPLLLETLPLKSVLVMVNGSCFHFVF